MNTKEKLLKAFEQFRPHINGHKTAINLFFEAIEEVEKLQEQVKNCSIPDVVGQSELLFAFIAEVKKEFADQNWDYLDFIAERVLKANNSHSR